MTPEEGVTQDQGAIPEAQPSHSGHAAGYSRPEIIKAITSEFPTGDW